MSSAGAIGARVATHVRRIGVCVVFAAVVTSQTLRAANPIEDGNTVFVAIPLTGATAAAAPDAIDAIIRDAHARGLRVHALVQPTLAAPGGVLPLARDHVIYRHPEWLMVPRELALDLLAADARTPDYLGRLARWARAHAERGEALYLSPLHTGAAEYVANAVARIVTRYRVDGVHLQNLRFPGDDFDYSRAALDAFRHAMHQTLSRAERVRLEEVAAIDPFGYPEELPDEWRRFRVTRLTALVTRVRTAVKAARPDALVSASVVRGADRALADHFQDWRTWLDNGFVDAVSDGSGGRLTLFSSYDTLQ